LAAGELIVAILLPLEDDDELPGLMEPFPANCIPTAGVPVLPLKTSSIPDIVTILKKQFILIFRLYIVNDLFQVFYRIKN
jgi:hypothetical protein